MIFSAADKTVQIWETSNGKLINTLTGHAQVYTLCTLGTRYCWMYVTYSTHLRYIRVWVYASCGVRRNGGLFLPGNQIKVDAKERITRQERTMSTRDWTPCRFVLFYACAVYSRRVQSLGLGVRADVADRKTPPVRADVLGKERRGEDVACIGRRRRCRIVDRVWYLQHASASDPLRWCQM